MLKPTTIINSLVAIGAVFGTVLTVAAIKVTWENQRPTLEESSRRAKGE